jgi:hypothetical protein
MEQDLAGYGRARTLARIAAQVKKAGPGAEAIGR